MGAELLGKCDITRLFKGADKIARLENRLQNRDGIVGIYPQISLAQLIAGKQRDPTGEVQDDIASRESAVARGPKAHLGRRGRQGLGEVIDRQFKGAKMPLGRLTPAFGNGKLPCW